MTGTAVGFGFAAGEIDAFFAPSLIGALHDAIESFLPGSGALAGVGFVLLLSARRCTHGTSGRV
ncbi:hypothetical protein [Halovivax sp.]|uniref:hypothetical protein n=1 Tax=Halovivax sp. TaxID=1935978 RepID=UPI0025BAFE06|nr:hypothetical protein [Halovivax sp.]